MSNFKTINNVSDLNLNNKWVDSTKFNGKDQIVDENGQTISSNYQGRKYRLISKKECKFSSLERIGRGFLGVLAVVASLGFALFSKSVRKLFTESKMKLRFAVLYKSGNLADVNTVDKKISINMVKSIKDIGGYCKERYPCQHGEFEIVLEDGRKVTQHLNSVDVYSILKGLKDIGITHSDWSHFSYLANIEETGMGWTIQSPENVLTKFFNQTV